MAGAPSLILETAVYVDDLEAAEAFYGGLLGLERIGRVVGRHAFFRCGPGVLLVFRAEATEVVDPDSPFPVPTHGARGPGHLCFAAEPLGIDGWKAQLVDLAIPIEAELTWPSGGRRGARTPDGE
jgi:catechol 2,3-dioxygenase-like lactoylglutathione lyase family enzyme